MAGDQKIAWSEESAVCASINGCKTVKRHDATAALRNPQFRIVWLGTFVSSIGTWMQNVVLGAYVLLLTGNPWFVALTFFACMGPQLFLSPIGGILADILNRRKFLVGLQLEQLIFSVALAFAASGKHPNQWVIFSCALMVGIGNALSAPAVASLLPTLVHREDLNSAVSLLATQYNLSRVVGAMTGAALLSVLDFGTLFTINAASYLFAIISIVIAKYPAHVSEPSSSSGLLQLFSGFKIAAADPLIRRVLLTMMIFSFFSLTFVGLLPVIATDNFGVHVPSSTYALLYSVYGLGALVASVTIGSFLTGRAMARLIRGSFLVFAALLACYALIRRIELAFPAGFALGFAYFSLVTSMSMTLQAHLDDSIRGRISGLWMMTFNGTVPLGSLIAGVSLLFINVTVLMLFGAFVAVLLAAYCNLSKVGVD
ncbi:MAG: MFS transporter [Actinomycetes bacterium]